MGVPASTHSPQARPLSCTPCDRSADEKPGKPAIAEVGAPVGTHGVLCAYSTAVPREVLPGMLREEEIPSDFEPDVGWLFVCLCVTCAWPTRLTHKQTNKQTNEPKKRTIYTVIVNPMFPYCAETGCAWATLAWRSFAP